jgi:hypothetical protein
MKKIAFYILLAPLGLASVIIQMIAQIFMFISSFSADLLSRYEYWSFDIPRGTIMNDPRYRTIKETMNDCWNDTETSTINRYLEARTEREQHLKVHAGKMGS